MFFPSLPKKTLIIIIVITDLLDEINVIIFLSSNNFIIHDRLGLTLHQVGRIDNVINSLLLRVFTVKVCEKQQIIREKKREQVRREKDALNILSNSGSSFFVKLYCTFQDTERLCILSYIYEYILNIYFNLKKK